MLHRTRNIARLAAASRNVLLLRPYHSYPAPGEKPVISTGTSQVNKTINKNHPSFKVNSAFQMDTLFPGVPVGKGISKGSPPPTVSSVLSNGLTVATQEMPGMMSSFALLVRTGSSYEDASDAGSSHLLELNAFHSTKNREHNQLISELEQLGAMVQCMATRENVLYCVDVLRNNTEKAMDIFADSILNPLFPDNEIEESKAVVEFQYQEADWNVVSRDLVQMAAYQKYPLGNAHFCPLDRLGALSADNLRRFRQKHFYGGNCIIAAAGVEHDSFVRLVEQKFAALPSGKRDLVDSVRAPSEYTGGLLTAQRSFREPFTKVAMAFEVGGWSDPMLVPTCVLQQLLGGGSSFSAGGPGKGMYSRLYTQVLNRHHWAEGVEAFVSIHESRGLMGIDGACPPEYVSDVIRTIVEQLTTVALHPVSEEELSRAKNMLKSMMMMQLESRLITCEDIGRQFVTYGLREEPAVMCARIDKVTAADLMEVGRRMLQQSPAVAVVGEDISHCPSYAIIDDFVKRYRAEAIRRSM